MSRRRRTTLDDLDRRIIAYLEEDGRRSNTDIARLTGSSETTIRKRIEAMIRDEIIRITAVANPLKLDYPIVAIFGIHSAPNQIHEVATALQGMHEFRFIGLTTGEYDFIAEAWFRTLDELRDFLTSRLSLVQGITHVDTSHVLQMLRYAYDWGTSQRATSEGTRQRQLGREGTSEPDPAGRHARAVPGERAMSHERFASASQDERGIGYPTAQAPATMRRRWTRRS